MVDSLDILFEDPDKEEKAVLPNAEVEVEETEAPETERVADQDWFDEISTGIFEGEGFRNKVEESRNTSLYPEIGRSIGIDVFARIEAEKYWNQNTGMWNIAELPDDEWKPQAIAFNNSIQAQRDRVAKSLEPFTKIAQPGEETEFDTHGGFYKFDFSDEGILQYYYRDTQEDEWKQVKDKQSMFDIQILFDQNEEYDVDDLLNMQRLRKLDNQLYDLKSINKSAKNAIDEGYILSGSDDFLETISKSDVTEQSFDLMVDVSGENAMFISQNYDKQYDLSGWSYSGEAGSDYVQNVLKDLDVDADNDLAVFDIIFGNTSELPNNLDALGVKLESFLAWVQLNKPNNFDLNDIIDSYIQSQSGKNTPWKTNLPENFKLLDDKSDIGQVNAVKEGNVVEILNQYIKQEEIKNGIYLLSNYFKSNVHKYKKHIKELNRKLANGEQITTFGEIEKISFTNWYMNEDLLNAVREDLAASLGNDITESEAVDYLFSLSKFNRKIWKDYQKDNFNDYYSFRASIEEQRRKNSVRVKGGESKGQVFEENFFTNFGKGFADRFSNIINFNKRIISGAYSWYDNDADLFNTQSSLFSDMVDDRYYNETYIGTPGVVTGVEASVEIDGVNKTFIMDDSGMIYDSEFEIQYVPDNPEEYEKVKTALDNSETRGKMISVGDQIRMGGVVWGGLIFDITGTFATRWAGKKTGLTQRIETSLANSRFKFNPSQVKTASNLLNTASYYGFAGAADGYINTYKTAIGAGLKDEDARSLANQASLLQGGWWFLTSVATPQAIYDKIPWAVSGFRGVANRSIDAFKKGGMKGYNSYWRNYFTNLSPTSRGVFNKLYNVVVAGSLETLQEELQEGGQQELINPILNNVVGKKLLDEDFTRDEAINTGIYSFAAGGSMGLLATGGINTNSQQYIQDLMLLGKSPAKLKKLLDQMVAAGDLELSAADQFYNDAIALKNQVFKLPSWIKTENTLEISQLLQQIDDLNASKKDLAPEFHSAIDVQIEDLKTDLALLYTADLNIGNQKIAEQIGYAYIEGNTTEIEAKIAELKKEDPNANVDRSIGFGAFVTANGKKYALIDTAKSSKKGFFTTGQHEGFHGLLDALVRRDPTASARLGKALLKEIRNGVNSGKITIMTNELGARLNQYINDPKISDNVVLEEIMPLLSEAMTRNGVVINEDTGTKIGDAFRRFFSSLGFQLGFNSGADVLNLVRDYNLAVESGKGLSRGLQNLAKGKGTFGIADVNIALDTDTSITDLEGNVIDRGDAQQDNQLESKEVVDSYGQVDNLINDPDFDLDNTFDQNRVLAAAAPVIEATLNRLYRPGSLLTKSQFRTALKNEYLLTLKKYNEEQDVNLLGPGQQTSNLFNIKAGRIARENLGKGEARSIDRDEARQVADTTTQTDFDEKPAAKERRPRAKVFPNSIKVISDNITGEIRAEQIAFLKNDITEAILRVGTDPKKVAKYIVEKTKTKEYRAIIKKALGPFGSEQYIDNVNKLFNNNNFIKSIPVANIKRRFGKLFGIKQTGTTPTIKIENGKRTDFNKQVYQIPAITDNKLRKVKQYFLAGEKRHQSLMSLIGEGLAVEGMNEIAADQEFMNNLQNRLDFRDSNLNAEQFMAELEFALDKRNLEDTSLDDVRLSIETEGETDITKMFESKDFQRVGRTVLKKPKEILRDNGYNPYPSTKSNWSDTFSDEQKKQRNEAVIRMLPEFGTDFFNSYSWFKHSKSMFPSSGLKKSKNDPEGFENQIYNKPLDVDFVKDNKAFIDKYAKKVGNEYFLDKTKIPKQGKALTKAEWEVLSTARTEQQKYAKQTAAERRKTLKDPKFQKLQNDKVKVLEKIVKRIDKDIRGGKKDGDIISARLEFWAAWIESQGNIPTHDLRVLAPIKFFSTSTLPFTTPILNVRKKDNELVEGALKNYEAEHMLPVNNVARAIIDMLVNNTIDKDFKFLADNYIQGQLLKTDDNIITKAGFQERQPGIFWGMKNPNAWVRYLLGNPNIDLNSYIMLDDNGEVVTVAEHLGLPLAKADQNPDSIHYQNELLLKVLAPDAFPDEDAMTIEKAKQLLKDSNTVNKKSSKQVTINKKTLFDLIDSDGDTEASIKAMNDADTTADLARRYSKEPKGISVFDFDDTLAYSDSKVLVKLATGEIIKITPAEFANQAEDLEANGAEFDFSEFNKVVNGRKGPLADLALKRQDKFGSGDIFVLTARPQLSAVAIKKFLDGIGLNIPLGNITGLENGSPEAKALWILDKTAQGYNDFYFADDALANVQAVKNVLDQVDVKSDIQQARSSKEVDLDKDFNVIIEQQSGKEWFKTYSDARAKVEGKKANRFEFIIPPSAEDFLGLMYKLLPKGKDGDRALVWIKENLINPFNRAEQEVIAAKIAASNDFKALRDSLENIPDNLQDEIGYSNYTYSQALRVFMWDSQGMEIPGLSTRDRKKLVSLIANDPDMRIFAEKIIFIQKGKGYPGPKDGNWVGGSITGDIINSIQKTYRKEALAEWQQNVDIIFSKKNLNKLEALYGSNYVVALKNILARMKSGSNRAQSGNPQVDNVIDWINNSVGTTMFLNRKSALLQLISNVNFINWSDNNLIMAGKAFANQKQYWKDVMYLMNSDYLVQRRNGMKINVAESEIAEASKKGGLKGVISYLLNKGFVFTRIADSIAIATGGATFYRNRLNRLLKEINPDTGKLYTQKEAERKAFDDFYQISEETQQSSRTDRISMQQASGLGRIVLNYANTPMQYARIIKRSTQDLLAGRGDWKSNVSKIVYYGAVQNLIFNALQQALFALAFGDEEEQKKAQNREDRAANIGFGMLSSLLRGLGYGGALVDTLISMSREISIREDGLPDFGDDFAWNMFDFSPTVDTKVRKVRSVRKTFKYNRDEIKRRGFSLENPAYYALAQVIDAGFNIPLDRAMRMTMTLMQMADRDTAMWQRFALALGWSSWSVGLPYWGTPTTVGNEAQEDANREKDYKENTTKLKDKGYKRIPMTKGKPSGKLNEDFIEVIRPNGKVEYWIIPKMKIK